MKSLFFIFGILFSQYIMPLMDGFGALILTWIESKKTKHSEIINNSNIRMKKAAIAEEDDDKPKYRIGFAPPQPVEKEEIEEEDDEDED